MDHLFRSVRLLRFLAVTASILLQGCNQPLPGSNEDRSVKYPETRSVDSVDNFHGTAVPDPYRWLEALDEPEVQNWAAEQNALTKQFIRDDDLRQWFAGRISTHAAAWEHYDEQAPQSLDQSPVRLEYTEDFERQRAIYVDADGNKRVLADPGARDAGVSVTRAVEAPDGRHAIIQYSAGGSEWLTTRIVRISDGAMLEESLDGLRWSEPFWTRDSRGFFYIHYGRPLPGQRTALQGTALRYHTIGTSQEEDHMLWSTPPGDIELIINAQLSPGGRYVVISEGTGAHTEGLDQLMARLLLLDLGDPLTPDISQRPTLITDDRTAGYRLVGEGEDGMLHLITDRNAPGRRVVAINPMDPSPSAWRELIPQHDDVLDRIYRQGDYYVGHYLRDAQSVVRIYKSDGQLLHTVELPSFASLEELVPGSSDDEIAVGFSSYLLPPTRWYIDLATGEVRKDTPPRSKLTGGPYRVTRLRYPSKDGVEVPIFVVHREDLKLDGSHPLVMHGYGASHTPNLPFYDETVLAWLEAGGVYAVPNIRGGGEFGREWWEAAILERKQTTFDDFIAAAEYLIKKGWTTPDRLAITGVSFGGLLVTAVMTERPDLFAAVVADVPCTDLVRFESGRHRAQIGSPHDPEQFPFVLRHSPQHRIQDGQCYPAAFITTAFNDERQPAWAAFKFTAALQAAQTCDRPVFLRADKAGGHAGRTWAEWEAHWADWLTFVAKILNMSVPKAPN